MALQFKDRIVQWAIYRHLNPFYDKQFIYDSYGCRIGKGTHNAANRRSIASYKGILEHFNSYGFRQSLNQMFKNRGDQ